MSIGTQVSEAPGVVVLPRDSSQLLSWWPLLPPCSNSPNYRSASCPRPEGHLVGIGRRESCSVPRPHRHWTQEKDWLRPLSPVTSCRDWQREEWIPQRLASSQARARPGTWLPRPASEPGGGLPPSTFHSPAALGSSPQLAEPLLLNKIVLQTVWWLFEGHLLKCQ